MPKNMPGGIPSNTLGVLAGIFQKVANERFSHRELELFAQRRNPFEEEGSKRARRKRGPKTRPLIFPQTGIDWLRVYRELGLETEFVTALPTLNKTIRENVWWAPMVGGVTSNKIVACFRELGTDVYTYVADLDSHVPTNDRDPAKGSYAVCFRQTIDADPDLANKSANMLAKAKVKGITLTECLLLGLGFFLQTGDHLDKATITLCSGSRDSVGSVPYVPWRVGNRELYVGACDPDSRGGDLRARAVVS